VLQCTSVPGYEGTILLYQGMVRSPVPLMETGIPDNPSPLGPRGQLVTLPSGHPVRTPALCGGVFFNPAFRVPAVPFLTGSQLPLDPWVVGRPSLGPPFPLFRLADEQKTLIYPKNNS